MCGGGGARSDTPRSLQVDYESYEWKKLDPSDESTKKLINGYFTWEGIEHNGKQFNQGKIFK